MIHIETFKSPIIEPKKRHSTATLVLLVVFTFLLTMLLTIFALGQILGMTGGLWGESLRFHQARALIASRYVGEVADESYLTDRAISAVVASLGDPWSRFLTAEQHEAHLRSLDNRQQGLGIFFYRAEDTNELIIAGVAPESPAYLADLQPGDVIATIDGQSTTEMDSETIRAIIHEHYGLILQLGLREEDEIRIVPVDIHGFYVHPVTFEMLEDEIGYIQISNFEHASGRESIDAIEYLLEEGAKGLIFDLRYNPGGRVNELLLVLDHLLPEGELFVFADYSGVETIRYAGADYLYMPMVVLINEHSASAAEYFAAVLKEREWATIVGMPTMGKGRSQMMFPLTGGGAMVLSISRYLTPNRVDLYEAGGVTPDIRVVNRPGGPDLQLQRAIAQLTTRE